MTGQVETGTVEQPVKFSQRVERSMPVLLMIWLLLGVLAPHQDTYKAFFYLLMVPAGLILLCSGRAQINWKDPLLLIALVFFAYAGITTFIVGLGPVESHLRALRWSVEITFGLIALFLWMPVVVYKPERWGYFFLLVALIGSVAAILMFVFYFQLKGRLTGLGVENPIQISSILLIYFAIGQYLLNRYSGHLSWRGKALLLAALFAVSLAVLLSKSRAPIVAMLVYFLFLGIMILLNRPTRGAVYTVIALVAGVVLILFLIQHFYGIEKYTEGLIRKGFSHRIEIWTAYIFYPPESILLGAGAGTPPEFHPAAEGYWQSINEYPRHPHNLILGTFVDTGIIGLVFLSALAFLVFRAIIKHPSTIGEGIGLFGIVGLIFMLTLTGSQTVISSIKAIWLFFWVPVVFIWFWCRYNDKSAAPEVNKALEGTDKLTEVRRQLPNE